MNQQTPWSFEGWLIQNVKQKNDPAYSPNLILVREDFSYA